MRKSDWSGVYPAITTPFARDGGVDEPFLARHAAWLIESGCRGIVALGSLGEGDTLTFDEKVRVLPEMMAPEWVEKQLEWFHPETVAYSGKSLNSEVLARLRAAKVKVLVDALGRNDNAEFWQTALEAGATGLQTDRPEELITWLRARGRA